MAAAQSKAFQTKTDFEGTTTSPLSKERLEQKLLKLSACLSDANRITLLSRLRDLEGLKISELFRFDAPT